MKTPGNYENISLGALQNAREANDWWDKARAAAFATRRHQAEIAELEALSAIGKPVTILASVALQNERQSLKVSLEKETTYANAAELRMDWASKGIPRQGTPAEAAQAEAESQAQSTESVTSIAS